MPWNRPASTHPVAYRIEAPLAEGGMGTVYRAFDTKLNRPVAIKFLSNELADFAARRRFQREAQEAEVAQSIAREVQVQIKPEEAQRLATAPVIAPAARELYLQGRVHFWDGNDTGFQEAVDYYNRAAALQPDYVPALARLSLSWHMLVAMGAVKVVPTTARRAAETALRLDPNSSEVAAVSLCWRGARIIWRMIFQ